MLLLSNIISVLSSHHETLWWQCHAGGRIFGNKHQSSLMERQMELNRGEIPEVGMLWSANPQFLFLLQSLFGDYAPGIGCHWKIIDFEI